MAAFLGGMIAIRRWFLLVLSVVALSACSESLEEKIVGRWINPADDVLVEFFHDKTVLMVFGDREVSGTWVVAGDARIKITALGTQTILLFEDIVLDGDQFTWTWAGSRGKASRLRDPKQPLTESTAHSKLSARYANALKSACALSPKLHYIRSFAPLKSSVFCDARFEVVAVTHSDERTAVVEARLFVDWKAEALPALNEAYEKFAGFTGDRFTGEIGGWQYWEKPTPTGCTYLADPPGMAMPPYSFESVHPCVGNDSIWIIFMENFSAAFDQPLPPLECDTSDTVPAEKENSDTQTGRTFSEEELEENCHYRPGKEERHRRLYTFARQGHWWKVTAAENAFDFHRKWQRQPIPEGSEGPFPEACSWAPMSGEICYTDIDSPCLAGDYVYSCY